MDGAFALAHGLFLKVGVLGFAGLWALKAIMGVAALRWIRQRRGRAAN